MSVLRDGWAMARLRDLAAPEQRAITDGPFGSNLKTAHYTESGPRVVRLQNIGDMRFINDEAHISQAHFERLRAHQVEPNDIVVAGLGEQLPRACLVPASLGPAIVKADCFRVRLHPDMSPGYVCAILNSPQVRAAASQNISGVGRPRLNLQKVRNIELPIPPAAEQRRILAAIEEQFSRLEAGTDLLKSARWKLERMRSSVLRAALRGDLITADQRRWHRHRLADVITIASGQTPRGLALSESGPIPFYKVGDMNLSKAEYMRDSRSYLDIEGAARFGLHIRPAGTVIFPKRGGAIATNKKRILAVPAAYDLNTMGLIPGPDVASRYLYLWLGSLDLATLADGSNVPQINHGDLADLVLNLPPMDEQLRIAAAADMYLDHIAALAATLDHSFARCRHLRSQVLASAFAGALTTRDPADEPAAVLLERAARERGKRDTQNVRSGKAKQARKGAGA